MVQIKLSNVFTVVNPPGASEMITICQIAYVYMTLEAQHYNS